MLYGLLDYVVANLKTPSHFTDKRVWHRFWCASYLGKMEETNRIKFKHKQKYKINLLPNASVAEKFD